MTEGARPRADDPFVLLVTDRPAARRSLVRGIEAVMRCRPVAAGESPPPGRPCLVVIDLDATRAARALADAAAASGGPVPSLILRRDADRPVPASAFVRSLGVGTPHATILAAIFAMIEDIDRAAAARARRLTARSEAATGIVAELFDSAALGAGLQQADADRGTDLVLEAVSEAGIGDWLATVWRHDAGVYQHTLSVAGYAAAFGARIGLGRADHRRLTKTALLHDIGKSRIPVEILTKPGRLTAEEMRLIRRHPDIGADLLIAQGGFEPAVVAGVRHHHERLDGAGYPAGLRAEAIPDLVRIVSICDVFSALTERRPYRAPADAEEALATMVQMPGHLDHVLVRAFEPVVLHGTRASAV